MGCDPLCVVVFRFVWCAVFRFGRVNRTYRTYGTDRIYEGRNDGFDTRYGHLCGGFYPLAVKTLVLRHEFTGESEE